MDVVSTGQVAGVIKSLATGTINDQIFSKDGKTLYTSRDGTVTAFDVASGSLLNSWALGTKLGGMDISADGRYLVATEQQAGPTVRTGPFSVSTDYYVYRLDLTSGTKTTYTHAAIDGDANFFDASFLSDGKVLLTQNYYGSGWEPLTTLDLSSGTFTASSQHYAQNGTLTATPDKTRVAFMPSNISDAPVFVYTTGTGVTAAHENYADGVQGFNRGVQAISPAGDRIVQGVGLNVYDAQLHLLTSLSTRYPELSGSVTGLSFSAGGDKLYALDGRAGAVFVFDTSDWSVVGGYRVEAATDVPYGLSYGNALQLSADGATLAATGSVAVDLIDLTKAVSDTGASGDDTLTGDGAANVIYGFDGNDTINGGAGADTMYGGRGDDTFYVDDQSDQVIEYRDGGTDTIYSSVTYMLPGFVEKLVLTGPNAIDGYGGSAGDTIIGNDAANRLYGNDGDDVLTGNGGADILDGGYGNDRMTGGTGNDTYYVDSPADIVIEAAGEGTDSIYSEVTFTLAANVEQLTLTGSRSINGTGNDLANRINGNGADNILTGLGGDDVIDGGAGTDTAVFTASLAQSRLSFQGGMMIVDGPDGHDTLVNVEKLRFADLTLDTSAVASINDLYLTFGGRAPNGAEFAYWGGELASGRTTLAGVRAAIIADPLGHDHIEAVVSDIYQDYGGRAPTTGELAVWQQEIARGASFDTVRSAILNDPLGATARAVGSLYQDYMGRAPSDGELGVWQSLLKSGSNLQTVRSAILNDPAGQAHTDATIVDLYSDYAGRSPTSQELSTWQGLVKGGYSFDQVRTTILDDPLGQRRMDVIIDATYKMDFARAPSADEVAVWKGLIRSGATFGTLHNTLLADAGSDAIGVQRESGTAAPDSFNVTPFRDVVITGFDPKADSVTFSSYYGYGTDPISGHYAEEVPGLGGHTDVLVTLASGHDVLLLNTQLSSLSADNFHMI